MEVKIVKGIHGRRHVRNETFPLAKLGIHSSLKGPFVLVDGAKLAPERRYPDRNFRIFFESPKDAVFENSAPVRVVHSEPEPHKAKETDREIKKRLKERFDVLQEMTISAANGKVRGLIVSGAPGTGKSFEVEAALKKDSLADMLSFNPDAEDQDRRRIGEDNEFSPRYHFVKGHMSAAGFYAQLLEYSDSNEVLVMDDCDSIFYDETSLNLLKAALDTTKERVLSWATAGRGDDLPKSFTYKGSLIFITNINFEQSIANKGKLAPHLEAMMDRCFYLDMTIETLREKLLRIEQVAVDFGMLGKLGLEANESREVMRYVRDNADKFRHLSLRKVVQLAELYRIGGQWKRKAELTLLKTR